jgi:hypothetical protein
MTTASKRGTRARLGSPVTSPDPAARLHHLLSEQLRTRHVLVHAKARALVYHLDHKGMSITEARARALLDTEALADEAWRAYASARVAVLTMTPDHQLDAALDTYLADQDSDDAF